MKKINLLCLLLVTVSSLCYGQQDKDSRESALDITIAFDENKPGDTLYLFCPDTFFVLAQDRNFSTFPAVVGQDGLCRFHLMPKGKTGRFSILKRRPERMGIDDHSDTNRFYNLIQDYNFSAGDQVLIKINRFAAKPQGSTSCLYDFYYEISGHGAQKYQARAKTDSTYYQTGLIASFIDKPFNEKHFYQDLYGDMVAASLKTLTGFQSKLSAYQYNLMKTDLVNRQSMQRFWYMQNFYENRIEKNRAKRSAFLAHYRNDPFLAANDQTADSVLADSEPYLKYLLAKANFDSRVSGSEANLAGVVKSIMEITKGLIRERLIVMALSEKMPDHFDAVLNQIRQLMKDPECKEVFEKLMLHSSGRQAYDFSLPDRSGKKVNLSDFKGKVVFIDFWFTGCGACMQYYQQVLSKVEEKFENRDIVFVTISSDIGKLLWEKSVQGGRYTSIKAINLYTEGKGAEHPLIKNYNFNSYPAFLIINREGKIERFNSPELHVRDPQNLEGIIEKVMRQ
jgi:thiol-disulfide isomerase/thioredoxin